MHAHTVAALDCLVNCDTRGLESWRAFLCGVLCGLSTDGVLRTEGECCYWCTTQDSGIADTVQSTHTEQTFQHCVCMQRMYTSSLVKEAVILELPHGRFPRLRDKIAQEKVHRVLLFGIRHGVAVKAADGSHEVT